MMYTCKLALLIAGRKRKSIVISTWASSASSMRHTTQAVHAKAQMQSAIVRVRGSKNRYLLCVWKEITSCCSHLVTPPASLTGHGRLSTHASDVTYVRGFSNRPFSVLRTLRALYPQSSGRVSTAAGITFRDVLDYFLKLTSA